MSNHHATDAISALGSSMSSGKREDDNPGSIPAQGFLRRYRLPLALAVIAICLYAGSILYILYGRGPIV